MSEPTTQRAWRAFLFCIDTVSAVASLTLFAIVDTRLVWAAGLLGFSIAVNRIRSAP